MDEQIAFTWKGVSRLRSIIVSVNVNVPGSPAKTYKGLIDTGASNTCVTKKVVDELGLVQVSLVENHTAGGKVENCPVYVADIQINGPHRSILFQKNLVVEIQPSDTHDLLIGMDILTAVDLAITNKGGVTKITMCYPSTRDIDFVPDSDSHNRFLEERKKREANKNLRKPGKKK